MAVGSYTSYYEASLKTNFLTWGQGLYTALTANAFVATADSGQINFGTAPSSIANGANWGYSVLKMNDSLQSSAPFFLKLTYANLANSGYGYQQPGIYAQFSTSTDGGGNCTGNVSPTILLASNQVYNATVASVLQQNVYASGTSTGTSTGAWFSAVAWDGSSFQDPWYIGIERTNNGIDGGSNTDGLIVNIASAQGGIYSFVLPNASYVPLAPNSYFCVPLNYKQASMAGSGVIGVSFPIPYNGRPYNYGLGCAIYQASDFGPQATNAFSVYGSNHTYRAPTVTCPASLTPVSSANARIMLRYE